MSDRPGSTPSTLCPGGDSSVAGDSSPSSRRATGSRVDRILFRLVDLFDDLKERWCRFWIADAETSQLLDRMEQEHELHEELERILKSRSR